MFIRSKGLRSISTSINTSLLYHKLSLSHFDYLKTIKDFNDIAVISVSNFLSMHDNYTVMFENEMLQHKLITGSNAGLELSIFNSNDRNIVATYLDVYNDMSDFIELNTKQRAVNVVSLYMKRMDTLRVNLKSFYHGK